MKESETAKQKIMTIRKEKAKYSGEIDMSPLQELEKVVADNAATIKNLEQQTQAALAKVKTLEDYIDKL